MNKQQTAKKIGQELRTILENQAKMDTLIPLQVDLCRIIAQAQGYDYDNTEQYSDDVLDALMIIEDMVIADLAEELGYTYSDLFKDNVRRKRQFCIDSLQYSITFIATKKADKDALKELLIVVKDDARYWKHSDKLFELNSKLNDFHVGLNQ